MAYSYVQYVGNGSTVAFSVPFPYIAQAHVKVRVNGVLKTLGTDYIWASASSIQFVTAPATGLTVDIRRESSLGARLVDFQDGSTLTEAILDADSNQNFYLAQEAVDAVASNIALDTDGVFDAKSRRIKNVADPVNPQDTVTKNWAETSMTSQVAQATAQATASASSAASAAASAALVAANKTNIDAVAANATNINTVAADKANIDIVAADKANIDAVAGNKTNIDAVAANNTNITTVAGDKINIDLVAANHTQVAALGNDLTGSPMVVDYGDLNPATNPASPAGAIGTVYANLTAIQNAASNAATASTKADVATTQAGIATAKATEATTQAGVATAQAGIATTKASEASATATNVSALLASFRSVMLGSFTSDANAVAFAAANSIAITDGIMYENSVSDKFRIYNGTAWQDYDSSAQVSQSAAALSAANAATSEANAATSASTATAKAGDATTQAGIATTQAGVSTTKAGEAATSASSALSSLNTFKGIYYGALASDPTLDPNGAAVGVGDLYLNTTIPEMRVYTGSAWVAAYVSLAGALLKANNLSDLQNVSTARTNLGLGALAVKNTVATADVDNNAITVAKLAATLDLGAL